MDKGFGPWFVFFFFIYLFISCELSSSARGRSLNGTWLDCKVSPPLKGHLWIEFIFKQGMRLQTYGGPETLFAAVKRCTSV